MDISYLKTPVIFSEFIKGHSPEECSLEESIAQNLELIIFSKYGEQRCDPSFGFKIWDLDFEPIGGTIGWEGSLRNSLMETVAIHEPRITRTEISIAIDDIKDRRQKSHLRDVKNKVEIKISARLKENRNDFYYATTLYLSPLSKK